MPGHTVFAQACTLTSSLVLLAGIGVLWRHSLQAYIDAFRWQSFFLVVAVVAVAVHTGERELALVAAILFGLKVVFIPRVLHRVRLRAAGEQEIRPYLGVPASVLVAGFVTLFSYAVTQPILALTDLPTRGGIPLALAVVFVGLLIVMTRRNALAQIVGYLVLENGIALLAVLATSGVPLIVEMGVFLDVLLGFLIMQVLVHQIYEEFESAEVDRLRRLRD